MMQQELQTVQTLIRLGAVWSGSALFAQAYLPENLGSSRYMHLVKYQLDRVKRIWYL